MSQKYGIIDRRSKLLSYAREKALENYYLNKVDCFQLNNGQLNMYVNRFTENSEKCNLYNELYSIFSKSVFNPKISLHPQQLECVDLLEDGNNLLLSAPTSFGKTFVALEYICRKKFNNVVFVVPTLALMTELSRKIYKRFNEKYNIVTDSKQEIKEKNIYVIVPERADLSLMTTIKNIDLLVFDEVYKLHSDIEIDKKDKRIIPMNSCYFDLVENSKQVLLLGPFIKNVTFERSLLKENIIKYYSDYSPVLIKSNFLNSVDKEKFIIDELNKDTRTIVYFSSPTKIYNYCEKIVDSIKFNRADKLANWCDKNIFKGWIPAKMLRKDICVHFASLPTFFKKYVEYQYNNEIYHHVLCTSTLLEGINTPTEELIIFDDDDLKSAFKVNNLIGRVGRLDTYKKGMVYYFDESIKKLINDETKYVELNIVAESKTAYSLEDAVFIYKGIDNLTDDDKELYYELQKQLYKFFIDYSAFEKMPKINIQNFINYCSLLPELLQLSQKYREEKNNHITCMKISNELYGKIIELFKIKYLHRLSNINDEIIKYNKENHPNLPMVKCNILIIKLLDMTKNVYTKIKEIISIYVGKIRDISISMLVEFLFYLAFSYIKYDLAEVTSFNSIIFNEKYLSEISKEDREAIEYYEEKFMKRIRKRNFDDDFLSKILDEIGIPGNDIKEIKKIIQDDCSENVSFSNVVNAIKKEINAIKNSNKIDDLTKEMIMIWE